MKQIMIIGIALLLITVVSAEMTKEEIIEEFELKTIYHPVARKNVPMDHISKETLIGLLNDPVSQQYTFGSRSIDVKRKLVELGLSESLTLDGSSLGDVSLPKKFSNQRNQRLGKTSLDLAKESAEKKRIPDKMSSRLGAGTQDVMTGTGPADTSGMKTRSQAMRETGFDLGRDNTYPKKSYFAGANGDSFWKMVSLILLICIGAVYFKHYK